LDLHEAVAELGERDWKCGFRKLGMFRPVFGVTTCPVNPDHLRVRDRRLNVRRSAEALSKQLRSQAHRSLLRFTGGALIRRRNMHQSDSAAGVIETVAIEPLAAEANGGVIALGRALAAAAEHRGKSQ